jgi:hypothetical protein
VLDKSSEREQSKKSSCRAFSRAAKGRRNQETKCFDTMKELVEELVWLLYQSQIEAVIFSVQGTLV